MQEKNPWKLKKRVSRGATEFHEAVVNASWNHHCLNPLISMAEKNIKNNDIVVDFGSGTGTSAIQILKNLKPKVKLWLVDNSPAWLGKAYEVLSSEKNVDFFLLEKKSYGVATLSDTLGKESVNHVISANTVHLIPNLKETFTGIAKALKPGGTFVFNTGNVTREGREEGILMLDSTIYRVHDIAIEIIREDRNFAKYKKNIKKKIEKYDSQRKFVFLSPRSIDDYVKALKESGFKGIKVDFKRYRLKYTEWIKFLRIKRLQAGILPEIGGKDPSPDEEKDRDKIIIIAAKKLFKELEEKNPFADDKSYLGEWAYVEASKNLEYGLGNKVALVTGASRGIGKAIALELARNNIDVIVNYRSNKVEANKVVEEVKKIGVECVAVKADVSNFDEVKQMMKTIKSKFNNIDILINNAGIVRDRTLKNMSLEEWHDVINTNLNGVFYVTKLALPLIKEEGRIVNISSIVGKYGNIGQCNYAAAKAGIIGFTKSLAKELGKKKITVNAIAPGFVKTDITKNISFITRKMVNYMTTLKEEADPEDIAYTVSFLASKKARYITGAVIDVNGGLAF